MTTTAEDVVYLDAPPPAAPAVTIANPAVPLLSWSHAAANLHYDIYRSASDPYFAPAAPGASLIAAALPPPGSGVDMAFSDDAAVAGSHYFYQIVATGGDGVTTAASNRVGRFIFPLAVPPAPAPIARFVILLIADGWGPNHIAAANSYTGQTPAYQTWPRRWLSTYAAGGGYDPDLAWDQFDYVKSGPTDSAAAATALYTGVKTANGRISVDSSATDRLTAITEKARAQGKAVGGVSSVQISHATPGAWAAHNDARGNGYAIADEGLWGDPNTTGLAGANNYGGGHGPTLPPLDVLIGGGHPHWNTSYVNTAMRDKLAAENGLAGAFSFVERIAGSADGGSRLLAAANAAGVTRLAGLFGGSGGNLEYRLADGSGRQLENPSLAQMAAAALIVLSRNPNGFVLMIEGGAVDWASHSNRMDQMVGEMRDFNEAVQAVIDWVEDAATAADWSNTLVIVTGDHETGYLSAGPGVFPDQPLGAVTAATLALEKTVAATGHRASWEDANANSAIDAGESVYWAWNSGSHTNTLIPLYAQGVGAGLFAAYATATDPVRGPYLDNTDVWRVMDAVLPTAP